MAKRYGMHLPGGDETAEDFAYLAARCERGQEQLDVFHAGSDYGLQVNGREDRDGRDLRSGCSLGNGFLEAEPEQLPLGRLAGRGDDRNNTELLPKLSNGTEHGGFRNFPAQGVLKLWNCCFRNFKQLVCLHGELRYLAGPGELGAATPVPVATERIHVGQYPGGDHKIGLLAGLTQQVEAHRHVVSFKTNQQFFSQGDLFWIRS